MENHFDDFLADIDHLPRHTDSARARATVWKIAQELLQQDEAASMTIDDLSQALARSAAIAIGVSAGELKPHLVGHQLH